MNSKQRKIAGKIRERAALDADGKIVKLEEERRLFAAERDIENIRLDKRREDIARREEELKRDTVQFSKEMDEKRMAFMRGVDLLKEANVVREVLLLLELDEEPDAIALKIRHQFGLLIPEW